MAKTPVVLVTFFRLRGKLGRTVAFNALTGKPIPEFYRHNTRPYYSASAAVRRSGTHEEMSGCFGVGWLRNWEVRAELDHCRRVHVEPITANAHRDRLGGHDWRGEGVEP